MDIKFLLYILILTKKLTLVISESYKKYWIKIDFTQNLRTMSF